MPTKPRTRRPTLSAYVGLPASGKSTRAREQVLAAKPGTAVRVNKDDARAMLHAGRWAGAVTEAQILRARDLMVVEFLTNGVDVHVDDTNLQPRHFNALAGMAFETDAHFEIVDFTGVDVEECIRRDAARENPVGEAVIRRMAAKELPLKRLRRGHGLPSAATTDTDLPEVVLCDIDGTLALMCDRKPYDWSRVGEDTPNSPVVALVQSLLVAGRHVIVLSGRSEVCREQTQAWLDEHVAPGLEVFMRPAGDNRRDSLIKHELYHRHIEGRYRALFVVDDRDQVVRTWRTMGLDCVQVAPGPF